MVIRFGALSTTVCLFISPITIDFCRLVGSIGGLIGWMVGWLVGWLVGWYGWLVGCVVRWLSGSSSLSFPLHISNHHSFLKVGSIFGWFDWMDG